MYNKNVNSCEGIYNNSLDVRFGKACDNDCSFCIEKSGIDSLGSIDVKAMVCSTLQSDKEEILVLGGEPFLDVDKLHSYVMSIRPFKEKIFITTSLPNTLDLNNKKVIDILDNIDGLNCSVHHYNWTVNNAVLNASSKHDRIRQLSRIVKEYPNLVRVQTNLVLGILDQKEEILVFIELMKIIGVKNLKINELQDSTKYYASYEKIMGIELLSPYAFGCQTHIFHEDINIVLKRSCFLTEKSLKPSLADKDKLKQHEPNETQVLYENGFVSNGWENKVDKEPKIKIEKVESISCHRSRISFTGGCH